MKITTGSIRRGGFIPLALVFLVSSGFGQEAQDKGKQLPAPILRKYDADRDGLLNEEEKAAWKADLARGRAEAQTRRLEQYDANKDGKLDKAEKAAAKAGGTQKPATDSSKKDPKKSSGSSGGLSGSDDHAESAVAAKSSAARKSGDAP